MTMPTLPPIDDADKIKIHDALMWWNTRGPDFVRQRMIADGIKPEIIDTIIANELRQGYRNRFRDGKKHLLLGAFFSLAPLAVALSYLDDGPRRLIPIGMGLVVCAIGPAFLLFGAFEALWSAHRIKRLDRRSETRSETSSPN